MQKQGREKMYSGAKSVMEITEKTALPRQFTEKMRSLLGEEFKDFIESYEKDRRFGLRINPLKESGALPEFMEQWKKIPWAEEGFYYDPETRPGKHPFHEAGLYYIQEPSAMAVTEALLPQPGEKILDLCAAPGGKTTHIAGKMAGTGLLVSNEIHPARARILSQNVERMGISNAVVMNEDPARLSQAFPGFFDGIAVDAPCSGEGMFRKDENARAEWSPGHVELCAKRQDGILDCAVMMLKESGRIVYSTCTFSPEENEGTVARFLARHPEFTVLRPGCADWFSEGRPEWAGDLDCLRNTVRIWPHKAEGEGHFLALLVRQDQPETAGNEENGGNRKDGSGSKSGKKGKIPRTPACPEEFLNFCKEVMVCPEKLLEGTGSEECKEEGPASRLVMFGDNLYRIPSDIPSLDGFKVLRPGLHLGTIKKGRFEPSHALALALKKEDVKLSAGVGTGETAARYLRGEAIDARAAECKNPDGKGWTLITSGGYSLGWAKLSGGVLKNHYPKGLRQP